MEIVIRRQRDRRCSMVKGTGSPFEPVLCYKGRDQIKRDGPSMDLSSACFRYWGKADPDSPGEPKFGVVWP